MPALYRFCRDLRLDDHAGLAAAAGFGEIVPVLILDELVRERIGRSKRRAAYFCAAVAALDGELRAHGSRLIVRRGPLVATLKALVKESRANAVVWSASYDARGMALESQLQSQLEERGVAAQIVHDAPAIPPEETAVAKTSSGEGYRALVPYLDRWMQCEPASYEAPLLLRFAQSAMPSEALPQPADFGADEEAAHAPQHARGRLNRFLAGDAVRYYAAVNVPADDRTSHLSADLTFGTIAARTVVRETRLRLDDPFLLAEERLSLRTFLRSLAQRDFFLPLGWYNPQTADGPLQEKMRDFPFARTSEHFDAWCAGRTGYPLVDAGIRQLHATGWMHPRVRAIAASFLCFDLGVDYRAGLVEWDRHLVEDDPALAIGNWQWVAGVGADLAAYPRIYNPLKQARRYDPQGAYVRRWIPELAHRGAIAVPAGGPALELPLYGPQTYPAPVVDHDRAARDFLARYAAFAATPPSARRSSR